MTPSVRRAVAPAVAFFSMALIAIPAWSAPVIVSAGATLIAESLSPANGVIDATETVTIAHCIQNTGDANTVNLVGTLQATGGVTSPSGPQNYGVVIAGGPAVCRNFTYTASGTPGGTLIASIQFQDVAANLGTVTYTFTLGGTTIVSAGATLIAESISPANGQIDPAETVTVSFCIQNTGAANTANLVGTLAATGGVTSPSGPQNYGVVVASGPAVCRSFTFTAAGPPGGTLIASIQFQDAPNNLGTITYTFTLGGVVPCVLTCPAVITTSNDPNQCGAVVSYPTPTTTGACGNVNSSPASGSFFPVGPTTVTATTTAGFSCTFTITVQDTQLPQITCPADIGMLAPFGQSSAAVAFNLVAADNCPGVTVQSTPPSGSIFPAGNTIDTSTATDASGNTATCAFNILVLANIPHAPIPTLGIIALLLLGLGIAFGSAYAIRRRTQQ